ncbi:MAG TPA: isochorismatase family cysteine hydrolase [Xanthobacteraceae bacterium]|nr:isochorismatase family cysteine hydrolase [Xanthobacteraceae bacterium]
MHKVAIPSAVTVRVKARCGKEHPFDMLDARRTALVAIDLQNYFLKGDEGATARAIIPAVNRLARELRKRGGHVIWVRNGTEGTLKSWSVKHQFLQKPQVQKSRYREMRKDGDGFKFWHGLDLQAGDGKLVKKRFSAFIQGSSPIEKYLRARKIDTILVAGTATNVCCESTARDAMMLNFKVVMVSDALAARSDDLHNAALTAFYSNFGDVQSVDEVVASLDRGTKKAAAASRRERPRVDHVTTAAVGG